MSKRKKDDRSPPMSAFLVSEGWYGNQKCCLHKLGSTQLERPLERPRTAESRICRWCQEVKDPDRYLVFRAVAAGKTAGCAVSTYLFKGNLLATWLELSTGKRFLQGVGETVLRKWRTYARAPLWTVEKYDEDKMKQYTMCSILERL